MNTKEATAWADGFDQGRKATTNEIRRALIDEGGDGDGRISLQTVFHIITLASRVDPIVD